MTKEVIGEHHIRLELVNIFLTKSRTTAALMWKYIFDCSLKEAVKQLEIEASYFLK